MIFESGYINSYLMKWIQVTQKSVNWIMWLNKLQPALPIAVKHGNKQCLSVLPVPDTCPAFVSIHPFSLHWCSFQSWSLDCVSFVALTISGSGIWLFSLQTSEVSYGYSPNLLLVHVSQGLLHILDCARYFRACFKCFLFNLAMFWQFLRLPSLFPA